MKSKPHPLRSALIEAIAEFITEDMARKSIEVHIGEESVKDWKKIAAIVGGGWITREEAIERIEAIL